MAKASSAPIDVNWPRIPTGKNPAKTMQAKVTITVEKNGVLKRSLICANDFGRSPSFDMVKKMRDCPNNKTKITLIHSGFTNIDKIQYDEHNEGWDWYTNRLEKFVMADVNESK